MAGVKGKSGGAREGAGRPPGTPGGGRPEGATDVVLSAARILSPSQKWESAEYALQHAYRAIEAE